MVSALVLELNLNVRLHLTSGTVKSLTDALKDISGVTIGGYLPHNTLYVYANLTAGESHYRADSLLLSIKRFIFPRKKGVVDQIASLPYVKWLGSM